MAEIERYDSDEDDYEETVRERSLSTWSAVDEADGIEQATMEELETENEEILKSMRSSATGEVDDESRSRSLSALARDLEEQEGKLNTEVSSDMLEGRERSITSLQKELEEQEAALDSNRVKNEMLKQEVKTTHHTVLTRAAAQKPLLRLASILIPAKLC